MIPYNETNNKNAHIVIDPLSSIPKAVDEWIIESPDDKDTFSGGDNIMIDGGGHLDYEVSVSAEVFSSEIKNAVAIWNQYKSGVIRKDTTKIVQDVKIVTKSSADLGQNINGRTSAVFNKIYISTKLIGGDTKKITNVITHELGHALGLRDSYLLSSIMYGYTSTTLSLSRADKASYDKAYRSIK